jgi:hypothetical protein
MARQARSQRVLFFCPSGDADGQKEVTLTGKLLLPAEGGIDYFCLPASARQA